MKRKRVLLLLCILNCTLQLFAQQINVQVRIAALHALEQLDCFFQQCR